MTSINSAPELSAQARRRVLFATTIGTAVEWYDYFLYAAAAGLVFNHLFFSEVEGGLASILSYLTVGLSFLFRPFGAFLAGYFGDRYGRRVVLMVTLFGMGIATTLIGVLPTYESIGIAAPILLIILRIIQGISAGGEWGGAVLLSVEHAPTDKRGFFGSFPQMGVPAGLLLSSGVLALMSTIAPGDAFLEWGWRVPFLLSIVLVAVGYLVRMGVEESPVFAEIEERKKTSSSPISDLFRKSTPLVFVAALLFAGNNAVGYMTAGGYVQKYASNPEGPVALDRSTVLWAVTASAVAWLITTGFAGWLSDKLGRRTTYIVGYLTQLLGAVALFPLINLGGTTMLTVGLLLLTVGLGLTYGQQSATYAELFPASMRFSGVSISYAIGAIFGGAFAPMIAQWLYETTGGTEAISMYLAFMTIVGLAAALVLRDRTGIPLGPDHEEEQAVSPLRFHKVG
ncbi:MFS transporter [Corynebacterium lowii]|uniref:Inner membrane metabolite transport protein YhjE n=1 Tax=Corynebacterium lowii TaxID=1544413 RepID=A0A0Q1E2Z8_9CORY|nr:MFS transporter [Corynebacterium lowii]KQB87000.1 Inner membrane metabolite transport protein YhjE [Corynebacterium lowii]MDP9852419.1 MFS family permease [Corynebacterium lowii]